MVISINEVFYYWETLGVFDYVLPLLLIFAVLYGILSYAKILGNNKGIHVIVSLVIATLAVRYVEFTQFYRDVFPRLGLGITVLLVIMISIGLFVTDKNRTIMFWIMFGVGIIVALTIIYNSFSVFGWVDGFGYSTSEILSFLLLVGLGIGIIIVLVIDKIESSGDHNPVSWFAIPAGGKPK